MDRTPAAVPTWAGRVGPLVQSLVGTGPDARQRHRSELWRILHAALFAALRAQAGRIAPVSQEDLEDLASGKALELLQQAEGNRWGMLDHGPDDVVGFVWRVARNALVDLARKRGREVPPPSDADGWDHALAERAAREAGPVDLTAAGEFVADLRGCLERMAPRSRAAWYRRAVLERPTRETARALGLKPPHVDVLVQRARESLTRCMDSKGHSSIDVHPQAFVLLWSRYAQTPFFDPQAHPGTPTPGAPAHMNRPDATHG
jgi:RNA polymerase sigma factor (sigma-70 family)